mmetsp:Transcript_26632/g.61241  ORF Transcript_26632/g.61241 Transcript_26632/m.61241 type:complete len:245 (+) Transcript_26632:246-980(+)
MLAVQVGSLLDSYEELRAVCPLPSIRHAEQARLLVLDSEVLVLKLLPIDRLATRPIAVGEVSSLAHELGDDPMEATVLVVERLPTLAVALVANAQGPEVLCGLRNLVAIQAEYNPSHHVSANGDIEETFVCDGLIAWDILSLHQILPNIPLALLHDANDNATDAFVLVNLPGGIICVAFLGESIVNDGWLALNSHLQRLLAELEVNVLGLYRVSYRDKNLDLLFFIVITTSFVPIVLAGLDRHG